MKNILITLLTITSIYSFGQGQAGEWLVYHVSSSNVSGNNNVSRCLFLQALPMESDSTIVGYIFGDPMYYFPAQAYVAPLRKCTSPSDATTPGECWTTYAQAVSWNKISPLDQMHIWDEKINVKDTVGLPDGWVMTKYAAGVAIDQLESDMDTGLAGKSNTGHTHAYSTLTSIPSTFTPSPHNHAPSDIISPPWLTSYTETDPNVPAYSKTLSAFSVIKSSTDALYSVLAHAHTFASITSKPTTLSGYGITDAYPLTGNPSGFLTSISYPGNNNATSYSAGTAYNLTTTPAKLDFGTTDPSITLGAAGTYMIISNVRIDYSGLTNLAANTVTVKLRRTNNTAADLTNATGDFIVPPVTLLTSTGGDCDVNTVLYTTSNSNDVIELWGSRSGSISVGQIQAGNAWIVAVRIY